MSKNNLYPENFPTPPDPLRKEKLDFILENELHNWRVVKSALPVNPDKERIEIYRELVFEEFDQVIDFVNKLRPICNNLPHHPRWENTWKTLRVYLSTWDSKHIITYKDILLARNIEIIYVNEFYNKYDFDENDFLGQKANTNEIKLFIGALRKLIEVDKINEVFQKIDTYYDKNEGINKPDELIIIQNNYNSAMSKLIVGNISTEKMNVEMNTISLRMLKFLTVENLSN